MLVVLALVVGIILGSFATFIIIRTHVSGNLRVDNSIPEDNPYMFLELSSSVRSITNRKFIVLKVLVEDFISRK